MNIHSEHLSVFIIVITRLYSIYWINQEKNNFTSPKNNLTKKLGSLIHIRNLLTFTAFGSYLVLYYSLYKIYYGLSPPNYIFSVAWVIDLTTTIGFWFLVYPLYNIDTNPQNRILDVLSHGPTFVNMSYILSNFNNNPIYIYNLKYSLCAGFFWLLFIWIPWYIFTNDAMYHVLNSKKSIKSRLKSIFKILLIIILSHCLGAYVY